MRDKSIVIAVFALSLLPATDARAAPPYPWLAAPRSGGDDIAARFPPPAGAQRIPLADGSFGQWLRHLPLRPAGAEVHLWDGRLKSRQDVHAAVVDIDVPRRDLQQCADAVMRLRAEYLWAVNRRDDIRFHPDPGKPRELAWKGGADRARFAKYLILVFAEAGTASLAAELPKHKGALEPGDVLIQGGYPGHAVIVVDAADAADGRRFVLVAQAYMPAQEIHVLKNAGDPAISPWYDAATLRAPAGLATPEWPAFHTADVRRFPR